MRKSFNADAVAAAGSNGEHSHQDVARARAADVHAWAMRTLARNGFGGEFITTAGPGGSAAASLNTPAVASNASVRRLVAAIRRRRAAH
jgi:hypothetical protein